jgi:hypothetical protein
MSLSTEEGPTATRCAWCGRFDLGGRWVENGAPEIARIRPNHGICPDCASAVRAAFLEQLEG